MNELRKAFVMLSAAIAMGGLPAAAGASTKGKAPKNGVDGDQQPQKKKRVVKVKKAKRRPSEFDPDLGMPSGTAYDVIERADIV
jgi:hypothetical protein